MSMEIALEQNVYSPRVKSIPTTIPNGHGFSPSRMEIRYTAQGRMIFVGSNTCPVPTPPSRERRVIRFLGAPRRPMQPQLNKEALLSSADLGIAAPALSTPRQRSVPQTDRHVVERRHRLVEANYFERESLMSRDRATVRSTSLADSREQLITTREETGAEAEQPKRTAETRERDSKTSHSVDFDRGGFSKSAPFELESRQRTGSAAVLSRLTTSNHCPHCGSDKSATSRLPYKHGGPHSAEGAPATRVHESRKTVRASLRMEDVRNSAAHAIPPNESSNESKMEELAELHNKLDAWYQGIVDADEEFRSDVLYLELKMQELLGPSWPERQAEPDMIRTAVCCDMLGRLISSTPAITKLGTALLEELMASIFQQKGRAVGKDADAEAARAARELSSGAPPRGVAILQLGEPYFATVRKLQVQVLELQEIVGKLRKDQLSEEEEKMTKAGHLLGRITGRLGQQSFRVWKLRCQRNRLSKQHYKQLCREQGARWLPRVFFKWLAAAEEAKRQRWQRIAEMLKWERDYGTQWKQDGLASPSSVGSRSQETAGASRAPSLMAELLRSVSAASSSPAAGEGGREGGREGGMERGRLLQLGSTGGVLRGAEELGELTAPWSGGRAASASDLGEGSERSAGDGSHALQPFRAEHDDAESQASLRAEQ